MEKPIKAPDQNLLLTNKPYDLPDPFPVIEPGGRIHDTIASLLSGMIARADIRQDHYFLPCLYSTVYALSVTIRWQTSAMYFLKLLWFAQDTARAARPFFA